MELEAIGGTQGIDVLLKGLKAADREVQFYAAEALAYLGRREAAEPLGQIARQEPAFRVLALTALAVLDDPRRQPATSASCSTCPAPRPATAPSAPCGR